MAKIKRICSVENCGKPHYGRGFCCAHWERWKRYGNPLEGRVTHGEAKRYFEKFVLPYEGDDCHTWPYCRDRNGYAILKDGFVHRLVCEAANGPPPTPEHHAAHSCGNGSEGCVTKGHVFWKTRSENEADKLVHGTSNRGRRHGMAKLTEDDVRAIRALHGELPQTAIARRFKTSPGNVSKIHCKTIWTWLD